MLVKPNYEIQYRDYKSFMDELFIDELKECIQEGNIIKEAGDIHFVANKFVNIIVEVLNKHAPVRKSKIRDRISQKPWISTVILKQMKIRDKLYKIAVKTNLEDD